MKSEVKTHLKERTVKVGSEVSKIVQHENFWTSQFNKMSNYLRLSQLSGKVWGKKTGHFLRSIAHQISILELKLIKRGPNEMSSALI